MLIYIDLKKAQDPTDPKGNIPSGSKPAGSKKKSKYGQKVWHRGKDRYPKRPNNALDETPSTWVLPYGQKPTYSDSGAKSNTEESSKPTPEEHQKLAEVAAQMGNTKLAEKHSAASKPVAPVVDNKESKKEEIKLPETEQEKAQNLIHTSKASDAKKKAKSVLQSAPSEHKEALKKIIEVLEDHETKPHVPTNKEKKDLREMLAAVNSMAKPIDKKRAEVAKEFKAKIKEKEKENKKIYVKTEKEKERNKIKEAKEKEKKEKEEKRAKEKSEKEAAKVEASKKKNYDKLKERLDRDIKRPASIEENAQKATHVAEAKEVLSQIEDKLKEADSSNNQNLIKLLEAHRAVVRKQLDVDRLPTKEDIKALKETKKVIQQQIKKEQSSQSQTSDSRSDYSTEEYARRQGHSSSSSTKTAYNTGRATGEQVSHQATQDSGGQLVSKPVGAVGYGVASAGHKLLTSEEDNETVVRKEVRKALESSTGIDSNSNRNTDTFDDTPPTGMGSDLPEDLEEDFNKALLCKLRSVLPYSNSLEKEFLLKSGYSKDKVEKGLVGITGLRSSKFQDYICDKVKGSIDSLFKSL